MGARTTGEVSSMFPILTATGKIVALTWDKAQEMGRVWDFVMLKVTSKGKSKDIGEGFQLLWG
ncbi:hypothetical protein HMPREF0294_2614 [Corynebacterium glucuronolyticum ATCC 51867]|nr:hypothetical protein HMPREF0294_2614 [Corynebacterium glucuronolyticum ATCC 51867]